MFSLLFSIHLYIIIEFELNILSSLDKATIILNQLIRTIRIDSIFFPFNHSQKTKKFKRKFDGKTVRFFFLETNLVWTKNGKRKLYYKILIDQNQWNVVFNFFFSKNFLNFLWFVSFCLLNKWLNCLNNKVPCWLNQFPRNCNYRFGFIMFVWCAQQR